MRLLTFRVFPHLVENEQFILPTSELVCVWKRKDKLVCKSKQVIYKQIKEADFLCIMVGSTKLFYDADTQLNISKYSTFASSPSPAQCLH